MAKPKPKSTLLKGWQQIAAFLGLPISAAQRWAKSGMPVTRIDRRVQASPEQLNRWLGHEAAEPVQIATESAGSQCRTQARALVCSEAEADAREEESSLAFAVIL